jgi:hypothetical protein
MLALLSKSVVAVSTKLSIATVLGLAVLPLLPPEATSRTGTPPLAAAAVEVIHAKPVPIGEAAAADPSFQLAARRSKPKPERPPETNAPVPPPAHKTSAITPAAQPAEVAAQPAPAAKSEDVPAAAEKTRAQQAHVPDTNEPARKDKGGPAKKTSSIAPPEPDKTPIPPPDAKPKAAQAEPPKPDVWSEADIIASLRECVKLLAPIAAEVEISQPVRHQACGAPAPVLLRRIGSGASKVEINPPAVLNCAMVVGLHAWVEKTLQPAARQALGSPVARLRNASGYVCRARNGHPLNTDRLSEHALANAIDIAGFITADGRTIDVARSWGPTERDRREAEKVAAAQSKDAKKEPAKKDLAKPEPAKRQPLNKKISAIALKSSEPSRAKTKDTAPLRKTAALQKAGRGTSDVSADPKAIPVTGGPEREDTKKSAEAGFLRRLHKGACGVFGTVLGPEANELHRDHFHFDLAQRRHSALCQ